MSSTTDQEIAKPASTSKLPLIATALALTLLAAGGGAGIGTLIVARVKVVNAAVAAEETSKSQSASIADMIVRDLPPILTNLSQPEKTLVRLQASVIYSKAESEAPALVTAEIVDDIVAYLKTLSLRQLQGGSGLQNLREDLNERVSVRSDGRVSELVIQSLVVQ